MPNIFFSEVLPLIEDVVEVKVVMQIFFVEQEKGLPAVCQL